jgi:hypothetical protein
MADEGTPPRMEVIPTGEWLPDGTFRSPPGWPEGAGWIVKNADGSIASWGPPSDFSLVVSTDIGNRELPPAEQLGAELKIIPRPPEGDS